MSPSRLISVALGLVVATPLFAAPASPPCNKAHPCVVINVNPATPTEQDDVPVGTVITRVTVTLNPSSAGPFTGTKGFGPPYGNGGGLFALSGSDVVLVAPFPAGSSVQHFTLVAQ